MSRIIVKNLPKKVKEDRVRDLFSSQGTITDCSLKFTKDGVFRGFAFIGYVSEDQAEKAVKYFNNTYMDTSKLQVELAKDLTDTSKPRGWSKYSKDSSAYKRLHPTVKKDSSKTANKKKTKEEKEKMKKNKLAEMLGDVKDDPEFLEFLAVNKSRVTKATWGNDDLDPQRDTECREVEDGDGQREEETAEEEKSITKDCEKKTKKSTAKSSAMSDLDYLKTKVTKSTAFTESDDDDDDVSDDETTKEQQQKVQQKYLISMKVPPKTKESQVREFFNSISITSVKIPHGARKMSSVITVEFPTEKDQELAMKRNKNFIGPKKIFLHKKKETVTEVKTEKPRPWEVKKAEEGEVETIAESGRLYLRNLAYSIKEEDLETAFSKYGLISEVHLPIDPLTKRVKGFAFVTFMMPEHAVKAYSEMDGKTLQGRVLHILPAKEKTTRDSDDTDTTSYKKKKDAKQKATAASSHNWNALFLGANAVADVMADKYQTTKSSILDPSSKESVGVRLALGETQVVTETRNFLLENGVCLDAFSQAAAGRSKTVMLAKNLPSATTAGELEELFGRHGDLGRVLLPPHDGLTAIVEFSEPNEAKSAFRSLAYSKFHHLPLYLEWAPVDVFSGPAPDKPSMLKPKTEKESMLKPKMETTTEDGANSSDEESDSTSHNKEEEEEEKDEQEVHHDGCGLFIKGLNFSTKERDLSKVFEQCGKVRSVTIAQKKDIKNPGQMLSMGYGFVEYMKPESAQKAVRRLQNVTLDDHKLTVKISHRSTQPRNTTSKRKTQDGDKKQTSTKILVRNIPFEVKHWEVKELFSVFGEVKTVRLPKKMSGLEPHRGFGFVDFVTKEDAKRAFNSLCHSTHLLGRRLVLEWADTEDSVEQLRNKTAQHYHEPESKRLKKSSLLEELQLS